MDIPQIIIFLVGVFIIIAFFYGGPGLSEARADLTTWAVTVSGVVTGVAVVNLYLHHGILIQRGGRSIIYDILLLLVCSVFLIVGVFLGTASAEFGWLASSISAPTGAASDAFLIYIIMGATYRAFRTRTKELVVLTIGGFATFVKNAPIFEAMSPAIPAFGNWWFDVPNMAAQRGLVATGALGMFALGLRVLAGYEKRFAD
jgi:hypothetical protein